MAKKGTGPFGAMGFNVSAERVEQAKTEGIKRIKDTAFGRYGLSQVAKKRAAGPTIKGRLLSGPGGSSTSKKAQHGPIGGAVSKLAAKARIKGRMGKIVSGVAKRFPGGASEAISSLARPLKRKPTRNNSRSSGRG